MKIFSIIVFLLSIVAFATFTLAADSEPISHKSFSIYDFVGGLWQLNLNVFRHSDYTHVSTSTTASSTSTDSSTRDGSDSISTRVADAMTPDFISSCVIERRPGFPSADSRKVYGLPNDLDIGTGSSRVIVCMLQVSPKAWNSNKAEEIYDEETGKVVGTGRPFIPKKVGMTFPKVGNIKTTELYIAPSSMNSADVFQVSRLSSIVDAQERAFYEKEYKISAAASSTDKQEEEGIEEEKPVFVVTHKGKLDVKHQFKIMGHGNNKDMQSMMGSLPQRAKHGLAHGSVVLAPVYFPQQQPDQDKEAPLLDSNSCSMQVTRVSALLTTKADVIVNVAVKYKGGELCFGEEQQQDENQTESSSFSSKKSSSSLFETNQVFLLNAKRFADVNDEEMLEPDTAWYLRGKYAPSIGAFVLLFLMVGGRKGVAFFLRKKGIDVDKFLTSTKLRTKNDIMKLRAERAKLKGAGLTEEEISQIQIEEQKAIAKEAFGKKEWIISI